MKLFSRTLLFSSVFLLSATGLFAQSENGDVIKSRQEAQALYNNFRNYYSQEQVGENGGSISIDALQTLLDQMKANGSKSISYRFGRTSDDKSGKDLVLFFNNNYPPEALDKLMKFKSSSLCPTDCNPAVDEYLSKQ